MTLDEFKTTARVTTLRHTRGYLDGFVESKLTPDVLDRPCVVFLQPGSGEIMGVVEARGEDQWYLVLGNEDWIGTYDQCVSTLHEWCVSEGFC